MANNSLNYKPLRIENVDSKEKLISLLEKYLSCKIKNGSICVYENDKKYDYLEIQYFPQSKNGKPQKEKSWLTVLSNDVENFVEFIKQFDSLLFVTLNKEKNYAELHYSLKTSIINTKSTFLKSKFNTKDHYLAINNFTSNENDFYTLDRLNKKT